MSFSVWFLGSLRLISFHYSIWVVFLIFGMFSIYLYMRSGLKIVSLLRVRWRVIFMEEILFLILLFTWSFVRSYQPDINGLEKFMDFGLMNSILRTQFFPPYDMWLAGETINYYYFGHLVAAVLTKLSRLSSSITYNLMIATILALSFIQTFSLAATMTGHFLSTLKRKVLVLSAGLISASVLVFGGNLHTVYTLLTKGLADYWYPDATRYIPYTIHEFPLYSFVVSDLHGHVSDIPFVLLFVAVLYSFLPYLKTIRVAFLSRVVIARMTLLGVLSGILYMTNALDAFIYLALFALLFLTTRLRYSPIIQATQDTIIGSGYVTFVGVFISLPFHLSFSPFAKGIARVQSHSSFIQLIVLWGFFLLVGFSALYLFVVQMRGQKLFSVFRLSVIATIIVVVLFSLLLVLIPEVVYIKDIYIQEYHRANTMFKLVYQTFLLMSIVTGTVFVGVVQYFLSVRNRYSLVIFILMIFLLVGIGSVLLYPYFAIRSYYNGFSHFQGLNGLLWIERRYPDDYAALAWLQSNIRGQPVILEAVGESYTDFARISANSGLPTVLGWRVHEWLWRGSFDEPQLRTNDVSVIYTSTDLYEVCELIDRYTVDFIFLGSLERQQYPDFKEQTLADIGEQVFSQGLTKVYSTPRPCQVKS